MSTTTFSGPVASQNGFVAPTFVSTALPYYTTGNIIYVVDLNTLAFGGEDQWYRQDTGAGLGTGGQGGGSTTVKTFKYYMSGSTADFLFYLGSANGTTGPGASSITFGNLDMYPDTAAALEALPVGTVLTVSEGSSMSLPATFTLTSQFVNGAGSWTANTTTSASFMPGMNSIQYFTAEY